MNELIDDFITFHEDEYFIIDINNTIKSRLLLMLMS